MTKAITNAGQQQAIKNLLAASPQSPASSSQIKHLTKI
jgi:hypothetical protein